MAGFFGFFDYTKPGPGIPKDLPPKPPIVVFFGVLKRKFWNLIKINLLFTLFNLPAIIFAFFALQFMIPTLISEDILIDSFFRFAIGSVFMAIPLITVGPAQAGLTFILRNYSREEHAFIWWDFKEHAIKNLKQSLIICFLDLIAIIIMSISLNFYSSMVSESFIYTAAFGVLALVFVLFFMMHLYIYPMLVTFNLTIKQIYKNALIFSIIKFLPNLLILIISAAVSLIFFLNAVIGISLFVLLTNSLIGLIINFYANPIIRKYMVKEDEEEDEN